MAKPKLLVIGFYAPGTGLSRVMEEILAAVKHDYDIDWLGIGYQGPLLTDQGYRIHPTNPNGGDIFAAFQAKAALEQDHYQVLLILADIWHFKHYANVLTPVKGLTRFTAYIPLDGNITDSELTKPLLMFDDVLAYTLWAAKELVNALSEYNDSSANVDVIAHGVETQTFFPLANLVESNFDPVLRSRIKAKLFPELKHPETSFIVLNPNRPGLRKHVELTIEAFAKFSRDKPDNVKLCLHHAMRDKQSDANVSRAIARNDVEDRIIWNPYGSDVGPVSDNQLNQLYQSCDVGLNTSSGEGWGLVSFEHGATGAAQIVPNHSACSELWEGAAELIDTHPATIADYSPLALSVPKLKAIVNALENLYADPEHYQTRSKQAYQRSTRSDYLWSSIHHQWRKKLKPDNIYASTRSCYPNSSAADYRC